MTDFDIITDGNTLYNAWKSSRKSSHWKGSTQKFGMNLIHNLAVLQRELRKKTYKTSKKHSFILSERGKTRYIQCTSIRDKVVRHAFCDNILIPKARKKLIYDNSASLKNRGVSFCRKRLKTHLEKYHREYRTNRGYILLMDYSSYYDNIRHDIIKDKMYRILDDDYSIWLLGVIIETFRQDVSSLSDDVIDSLYHGKYRALDYIRCPKTGEKYLNKSIDIGDQSSQIIGVSIPTEIDTFVKTVSGMKYYGRYMDDSYIISNSKNELLNILSDIIQISERIGIIINRKKIKILPIHRMFSFLQNRYIIKESGKIVEKINPERIRKIIKRMKKLSGYGRPDVIQSLFLSWYGNYKRIMNVKQKNIVLYWYKNII